MAPASKQKAKLIPSIERQPTKTLQDLTQDIKGIVEDILAKNLDSTPTPISDERSVPIARPKTSDDIRELTEDARDQIYHLMRPIERIFGSEALEPERKAPKRFLQYREKIQQLNNACEYYTGEKDFGELNNTFGEFLNWLGKYLDSLVEFETNRVFAEEYESDDYPHSIGTFKIVDTQVVWSSLREQKPPKSLTSKKRFQAFKLEHISALLETQLQSATFHLSISSDTSFQAWREIIVKLHAEKINKICVDIAKEHGTWVLTDPCSDPQAFLDVIGQRCHRIVEKFETQAPEHAEWTIDALYNWVVRCSKEFKDFIEDYSEIIKEDQGKLYLEWNKIANKSSATMPEIEKNTVDRFPTKGQYWRTKYLKSLGEEEPASPSGRLLRLEPNEIYMAQEDFEDIKLPRQMEAINTKIQMLNIDGSPAKTKNGTKVMKYLIDMKSEYREKLSNKRNYEEDEETNSNHITRSRPRKS